MPFHSQCQTWPTTNSNSNGISRPPSNPPTPPQTPPNHAAAPSTKHHTAGPSSSTVLTACQPNQVLKALSLLASTTSSPLSLPFKASVILTIGPATIGTNPKCPKANKAPQAYHLLAATAVVCDRSQRAATKPDAADVRATPAMRVLAGARKEDQKRERGRPEILVVVLASSVLLLLVLLLCSFGCRKAKNRGYWRRVMPRVAEEVQGGG